MSEEALQAIMEGENPTIDAMTGVPDVSGDEVLEQLTGEKPEPIVEEEVEPEKVDNGFLEALGVIDIEPEEAYALKVRMQDADGQVVEKTVGELKDEFERSKEVVADAQNTTNELAARTAAIEAQEADFRQRQTDLLEMPNQLAELEQKIVATQQYIQANEENLAEANPGQLALARQELLTLEFQRNNGQQALYNQRQAIQDSIKQEQIIRANQTLQKAEDKMLELIPDWTDPELRNKESMALIDYGVSKGFTQQQMTTITDPIAVKYLREQMLRDKSLAEVKAKVDAPRALTPQTVKMRSTAERAAHNKLIKKATDSRDSRDKIEGIVALMNQ